MTSLSGHLFTPWASLCLSHSSKVEAITRLLRPRWTVGNTVVPFTLPLINFETCAFEQPSCLATAFISNSSPMPLTSSPFSAGFEKFVDGSPRGGARVCQLAKFALLGVADFAPSASRGASAILQLRSWQ